MNDANLTERPLTGHFRGDGEPAGLDDYERAGGYTALRQAVREMAPEDVIQAVSDSNLMGRGGAGFPTGTKESLVPKDSETHKQRYVVCNADEMEPGTFKDRILIGGSPHQLIEGVVLSAFAAEASVAYIFIRGEYTGPAAILTKALLEAREKNYIGDRVMGTGFSVEVHLHRSVGRYMCGEETGMLNALEGKRANPRPKPPYPTTTGLWGRPTVINNVETLCCVPHIVRHGAQWFRGLSRNDEGGTKIYSVAGRVRRPGAWERPLGMTIREIIEDCAGGMRDGYAARAVIPGGASTDFILEKDFDVEMGYQSLKKVGSRLGTAAIVVLDDKTCPVGMVCNLEQFFAQESCGWCTPCREGLPWIARILEDIERGEGRPEDLDLLEMHAQLLGPPGHTFCVFAPGAMEPLASALKFFREDFDRHINEGRCPWR